MEGQYGALRYQQPTCPNLGRLLQMESAMPEIKSNHVEMMRQLADALSGVDCDRFNLYLAAAEKCVKQSVPIAEAVRELNRQYAVSVSAKSISVRPSAVMAPSRTAIESSEISIEPLVSPSASRVWIRRAIFATGASDGSELGKISSGVTR